MTKISENTHKMKQKSTRSAHLNTMESVLAVAVDFIIAYACRDSIYQISKHRQVQGAFSTPHLFIRRTSLPPCFLEERRLKNL